MTRLILTTSDSGAGCLRGAGISDIMIPLGFRLVWGALPSDAELAAMLGPGSLDRFASRQLGGFDSKGVGLRDLCDRCETVELWIDPLPNGQLVLIQLLDFFRPHEKIVAKLALFQADIVIGNEPPETLSEWKPTGANIRNEHLVAATTAWRAYRQPTPEQWFGLLGEDTDPLPQLGQTVLELLEELPGRATGLGATEMRMLKLISTGNASPFDVFSGDRKSNARRVFEYWETGSLLDGLARCPAPAVSGLEEGPFTEAMHEDAGRYARYKQSKLTLTALGQEVVAQTRDFSRHNPIHRWWGGTELTNGNLWRWDPASRGLVAP